MYFLFNWFIFSPTNTNFFVHCCRVFFAITVACDSWLCLKQCFLIQSDSGDFCTCCMKMVMFTIHHQHGSHSVRKVSPRLDLPCQSNHTVPVRTLLSCSKLSTCQMKSEVPEHLNFLTQASNFWKTKQLCIHMDGREISCWPLQIAIWITMLIVLLLFEADIMQKIEGKRILKDHSSHVCNYLKMHFPKALESLISPTFFLHHCWLPRYLPVHWKLSLPIISYLFLFDLFLHWCHT